MIFAHNLCFSMVKVVIEEPGHSLILEEVVLGSLFYHVSAFIYVTEASHLLVLVFEVCIVEIKVVLDHLGLPCGPLLALIGSFWRFTGQVAIRNVGSCDRSAV